jgi:homoserine kinase
MKKEVTVFSPATVSNVGPGFDLLGFALEEPGDELLIRENEEGILKIIDQSGFGLPLDPSKNIAAISARSLLDELKITKGYDLVFLKKIKPGSGIGSSAASCAAAVVGINELLGSPMSSEELLPYAMEGEQAASGSYHADNIAPALLGGFTLIKGYDPLDIKHIPYPEDLVCALVHPDLEFKTSEGRKMLPKQVPMATALAQAGNLAGLIAGLTTRDYGLIGRSIIDHFAEPYRSKQLPEFDKLRELAITKGALGFGLSGSGPSVFALCRSIEIADQVAKSVHAHFLRHTIKSSIYLSRVSEAGCRITG